MGPGNKGDPFYLYPDGVREVVIEMQQLKQKIDIFIEITKNFNTSVEPYRKKLQEKKEKEKKEKGAEKDEEKEKKTREDNEKKEKEEKKKDNPEELKQEPDEKEIEAEILAYQKIQVIIPAQINTACHALKAFIDSSEENKKYQTFLQNSKQNLVKLMVSMKNYPYEACKLHGIQSAELIKVILSAIKTYQNQDRNWLDRLGRHSDAGLFRAKKLENKIIALNEEKGSEEIKLQKTLDLIMEFFSDPNLKWEGRNAKSLSSILVEKLKNFSTIKNPSTPERTLTSHYKENAFFELFESYIHQIRPERVPKAAPTRPPGYGF